MKRTSQTNHQPTQIPRIAVFSKVLIDQFLVNSGQVLKIKWKVFFLHFLLTEIFSNWALASAWSQHSTVLFLTLTPTVSIQFTQVSSVQTSDGIDNWSKYFVNFTLNWYIWGSYGGNMWESHGEHVGNLWEPEDINIFRLSFPWRPECFQTRENAPWCWSWGQERVCKEAPSYR